MRHRDTHKMTPEELAECGCEHCLSELRLHGKLNLLVLNSHAREYSLNRIEGIVGRLEAQRG